MSNTAAFQDPLFWVIVAAMLAPVTVGFVLSLLDIVREMRSGRQK
jgi:ribosomal protein S28E/S33